MQAAGFSTSSVMTPLGGTNSEMSVAVAGTLTLGQGAGAPLGSRRFSTRPAEPTETDHRPMQAVDRTESGFADLIREHHVRLTRLAYALCGSREEAEDAVADAYAKVWPRFRAGTLREPLPYLRAAVVNQVRGRLRRRGLQRREEQRQRVDWREGQNAERVVDDRETLTAALDKLAPKHRTVLVLRFYEDMSEQDVCALLRLPVGTVKSRCARALAALRAELDVE